jgi:uncharacterized protein YbaR (Trm112 family)/SAM-dependent methyltransferase
MTTPTQSVHEKLLTIIACPDCRGELIPGVARDGETLACTGCTRTFPVIDGIPYLLPASVADREANTGGHFTRQFTAFEPATSVNPLDDFYFYSRTGLDPEVYRKFPGLVYAEELPSPYTPDRSALNGKVVLDGGCGQGRFTRVAARSAAMVIGLDLGEHVHRAAQECAGLENVAFVRGSVLEPPFKASVFDEVFTVGVIHHTPSPDGATKALADLLKAGGGMAVWVYPPAYWGGPIRAPFNQAVNRWLRNKPPEKKFAIVRDRLYPLGRLQAQLARRKWTKLLASPLFLVSVPRSEDQDGMIGMIFDYFGPPIISTHTYEEVTHWLRAAGMTNIQRLPIPTACRATKL